MSNEENLEALTGHVETYAKHRAFIDRARAQSEKFSSAVIEKVALEHEIKCAELADTIVPLAVELEAAHKALESERDGIIAGQAGANDAMEELSLRQMIGELDDEGFEAASKELKEQLGASGETVSTLETQMEALSQVLGQWAELAEAAGQDSGLCPDVEEADDVEVDDGEESDSGDEAEAEAEAEVEIDLDEPASDDDALPGFDDDDDFEIAEDSEEVADVEVDFDDDDDDDAGEASEDDRRALVIAHEGTDEEQFYPFNGDVLTIGRGRDNDIQITNDSKVSRYHCRIFKRNANYFIEDNKSSNGTLVNGELITELQLCQDSMGNARDDVEIIVGETFFRFRLMD